MYKTREEVIIEEKWAMRVIAPGFRREETIRLIASSDKRGFVTSEVNARREEVISEEKEAMRVIAPGPGLSLYRDSDASPNFSRPFIVYAGARQRFDSTVRPIAGGNRY